MSTIIYSFCAYHYHLLIIHHLSYIIHYLDAAPLWSLQLALSGWLGLLKVFSFYFGSLFCSALLVKHSLILTLFDFSGRLSGHLCFLDGSFLSVLFGQLCSIDDSLLGFFPGQFCLLKNFFYWCSLVSLESFLVSFAFWIAHSCRCYLINFAL